MKKVQKITAVKKETYIDKLGNEKRESFDIGKIFTDEKGYMSLKIDFMPANVSDYFLNVYDIKKQQNENN